MSREVKVGLLWRQEWDPPQPDASGWEGYRLHGVFAAFADLGTPAEGVVYGDDRIEQVRAQLLGLDGVLVWVNPIEQGRDRSKLDPLLREAASEGVWVSAHPDVILRMATKRVLYDTRELSWGTDTRIYLSAAELHDGLASGLSDRGPCVLKQQRGMGGQGVWKVETWLDEPMILVQEARRDAPAERMSVADFAAQCEPYFEDGGLMVEQPFQERIGDGMVRVYLTHDEVVGFAHQYPAGLRPASAGEPPPGKRFEAATAERFQSLRNQVELDWVPEMLRLLHLDRDALPVIWDIDFLHGPDSYVLCEINASSTFAFPEHAMPGVAAAALARIGAHR
jgi:glutathione synthase/RimK-type ligase-like ATP-grasp enzyme